MWNINSGECSHTLKGHIDPITSIKIENNFIVSGSKDRTVKVWEDWECRSTLVKHKDWIKMIDFNDTIISSFYYLLFYLFIINIIIIIFYYYYLL